MFQLWLSEKTYRPCEVLWFRGEGSTGTPFVVPNGAVLERGPKVFLCSIRLLKKCFLSGCSKMPRCKAPVSLSPAVQAGNPEE